MSESALYRLHGLTLDSQIPLPDEAADTRPPDIVATLEDHEPVPDRTEGLEPIAEMIYFGTRLYTIFDVPEGALVRISGMVDFLLDPEASTIRAMPDADIDQEVLGLFLSGTALSTLMTLQGLCVLHASAVEVDGRAVVFAGLGAMGKSTCAALACAIGASLITDDVLVVDLEEKPICRRGTSRLRLRQTSSGIVDSMESVLKKWTTIDGRTAVRLPSSMERVPISAVVIPMPKRDTDTLSVERPEPTLAVADLLQFVRIPGWKDPSVIRQQFRQAAVLADRVDVYRARIPWGPPFDLEPMRELLDMVAM